jgi:hypothetical protein
MSEEPDDYQLSEEGDQGVVPEFVEEAPTVPLPIGDDGPHEEDIDPRRARIAIIGALISQAQNPNTAKPSAK